MDRETWQRLTAVSERLGDARGPARARLVDELRADPLLAPHLDRFLAALDGADGFAAELSREVSGVLARGDLRVGQTFGAWRIERVLGAGGMGTVYLAQRGDEQYEKTVALKVMSDTLRADVDRERFLAERRTLARLEHPAIARLIDAGIAPEGHPYYVLEHVEGQTADAFADAADLDRTLAVFLEVCAAVAHAHANLVIHCDLKPSNVLVTADGHAKLLDFGIARGAGDEGEAPSASSISAPFTRNYAAPELLLGGTVDTRADVYSLGVLLYRLLTGAPPYQIRSGTREELHAALQARAIPPIDARGRLARSGWLARRELEAIVLRATELERERRTPSVAHLVDQLDRWRAGAALDPPPSGVSWYAVRKAARRNPFAVVSAALVLVTLVALAGALAVTRAHERRAREQREVADAVLAFVERVFAEADPDALEGQRGQRTARELIESAAARLELEGLRENAAGLRLELTVGRLAGAVGSYDRAEALLAAVAADERDPVAARAASLELAQIAGDQGAREAAREQLARVVAACTAAGDQACALEALRRTARNEVNAGDPERAGAAAREGLARLQAAAGDPRERDRLIADFTFTLGYVDHRAGRSEQAVAEFEEALRRYEALPHPRAIELADASSMMADVTFARGDAAGARPHMERARGLWIELLGARHPHVAYADRVLSNIHVRLGDAEEAVRYAQESADIRRERLGPQHPETAESLTALARALLAADRAEDALAAVSEARQITEAGSAPKYHSAGRTLAQVLARLGRAEEALPIARAGLAYYESTYGVDSSLAQKVREEVEGLTGPER